MAGASLEGELRIVGELSFQKFGIGGAGGRWGGVRVGGAIFGEGISHLGSQYDWAPNMITQFEMVFIDSHILEVSLESHPDSF